MEIKEGYSENNYISLYKGDCLELLKSMPDETCDLIITSPPYCIGKEYEDKNDDLEAFKEQQRRIIKDVYRVLKVGGSICWQVGYHITKQEVIPLDYYVFQVFNEYGTNNENRLKLRNRIVWTFGHGLNPSKRFSGRHETILWFTKGDIYPFDLDSVRVPQKYPGKRSYRGNNKGEYSGNALGKNPSDVWRDIELSAVWDMSILQINQIVKRIRNKYDSLLDFSDISNFDFSKKENIDIAVTRGLNAFVIEHITGCTPQEAAAAVTDSGDDNGIDAIYYDNTTNCLYVTQSKYDHNGKGEPDLGSVKKFLDGFNDLLEMKFWKFCQKIKKRQSEIESILEKPSLTAKLLLIYTGVNKSQKNIDEFEQLMEYLNDYGSQWLSYEYYTQNELYQILITENASSIDTELVIHNYGFAESNSPRSYYGQVAAADIGELWKQYGSRLFSENIRNLLSKSDINDSMLNTLKTASRLFWYYNNGITKRKKKKS